VGFVVDTAALKQVFFEYACFPCQAFHRLLQPHHHPSLSGAGTDLSNGGLGSTSSQRGKITWIQGEWFMITCNDATFEAGVPGKISRPLQF
jgi:hypothetical protein